MGASQTARFDDIRYLNHLDAVFARLYFRAFDTWRAGRADEVPEAWRLAFDAADKRQAAGIGDMLLGMNAHISRDLPFALEGAGLRAPDGASGKPDFDRVNGLPAGVQGPMIREEADRFDPTIAGSTLPLARGASSGVGEVISRWRTEAWENAERLLDAPDGAARARVAQQIETTAAGRARVVMALTSNLVLGPGPDVRTRCCENQRDARRG